MEAEHPRKRQGRPRGAQNMFGREAKQAVSDAFEAMGGVHGLIVWAMNNPDAFYLHIWTRLIPKELQDTTTTRQILGTVTNAVNVMTPVDALTLLERLENDRNPPSGDRGEGDVRPLAQPIPAHAIHVQEVDGGGTGPEQEAHNPDASKARENNNGSEDFTVPLSDDVSEP